MEGKEGDLAHTWELYQMIPLLTTIISIYCVLRLIEMGSESSKKYQPPSFPFYHFYYLGAMAIIILCFMVWSQADEVTRVLSKPK